MSGPSEGCIRNFTYTQLRAPLATRLPDPFPLDGIRSPSRTPALGTSGVSASPSQTVQAKAPLVEFRTISMPRAQGVQGTARRPSYPATHTIRLPSGRMPWGYFPAISCRRASLRMRPKASSAQ